MAGNHKELYQLRIIFNHMIYDIRYIKDIKATKNWVDIHLSKSNVLCMTSRVCFIIQDHNYVLIMGIFWKLWAMFWKRVIMKSERNAHSWSIANAYFVVFYTSHLFQTKDLYFFINIISSNDYVIVIFRALVRSSKLVALPLALLANERRSFFALIWRNKSYIIQQKLL